MTVISRTQQACCEYSSCNNSDTESLHLASDTESVHFNENAARRNAIRPLRQAIRDNEQAPAKKNSGKKKLRRYLNVCTLKTLSEEDEEDLEYPTLVEVYKSPFTRLLEDNNALDFWNSFVEKSEEEQSAILKSMMQKSNSDINNGTLRRREPFARISSKIKRTMKIRKNLAKGVLDKFEKEVVEFFKATPENTYLKVPSTSFERLLLHAIAQFHDLSSLSVTVDAKKQVKVYNSHKEWTPVIPLLQEFILVNS